MNNDHNLLLFFYGETGDMLKGNQKHKAKQMNRALSVGSPFQKVHF